MYNQICPYFNKMFQCGFYKGFNAQHHLLLITGKRRVVLDNVRKTGAALTDLFKALGWINQNLLIAKLNAYGVEKISLDFIHYYLTKRKKNRVIFQTMGDTPLWGITNVYLKTTFVQYLHL